MGGVQVEQDGGVDQADGLGAAESQFEETAVLGGFHGREGNLQQHLVWLHDRPADAGVEIRQGDLAGAARGGQGDVRSQGHQRGDGVVGGAGGDDVAGDGGAVADLRSAHLPGGADEREGPLPQKEGGDGVVVSDQRADVNDIVLVQADAVQAGQAGDVDDGMDALTEFAFEFKHQVGAPGDQAGLFTFFGQQLQGLIDRGGLVVFVPHGFI